MRLVRRVKRIRGSGVSTGWFHEARIRICHLVSRMGAGPNLYDSGLVPDRWR